MKQEINQNGFTKTAIILIIIGVLIISIGIYYFLIYKKNKIQQAVIPSVQFEESSSQTNQTEQSVQTSSSLVEKNLEPIDCGKSIDCLITASQDCNLAKSIYTFTTDIFGVKETTNFLLEIKGIDAGKCIFYLKIDKIDLSFAPEIPPDVINQQKTLYKAFEGRDGICKFAVQDLTSMLKRWKEGNFSNQISCNLENNALKCSLTGEDFAGAECKGSAFETLIQSSSYKKRIPANTSTKIELFKCPDKAERLPVQTDGTACFDNQNDLGSIKGITVNGKPVQCCVPK